MHERVPAQTKEKHLFVHSGHLIFKWKSKAFGGKIMNLLKALN